MNKHNDNQGKDLLQLALSSIVIALLICVTLHYFLS